MESAEEMDRAEEEIRQAVRQLPDAARAAFHRRFKQNYKDPDTYATLNYLFIAGLHHFYLGKNLRGLLNLSVFSVGLFLLFTPFIWLGGALILGITAVELVALFFSQRIVQRHNLKVMRRLLARVDTGF